LKGTTGRGNQGLMGAAHDVLVAICVLYLAPWEEIPIPAGHLLDLAGSQRLITAQKGKTDAVIREGETRRIGFSLTDTEDVSSKPVNEQHLFTPAPKY
jgi:hypothetical protein